MSSSAFSASASACTSASAFPANTSYGACADVDPAPMTLNALDAMEAGSAGQGRIVPAHAGHLNSSSEQCSKYYTQAFAFDDDDDADAAEEYGYGAEHAEGEMRSGPLGKRPKGTAGGLKGGNGQEQDPFGAFSVGDWVVFIFLVLLAIAANGFFFWAAITSKTK